MATFTDAFQDQTNEEERVEDQIPHKERDGEWVHTVDYLWNKTGTYVSFNCHDSGIKQFGELLFCGARVQITCGDWKSNESTIMTAKEVHAPSTQRQKLKSKNATGFALSAMWRSLTSNDSSKSTAARQHRILHMSRCSPNLSTRHGTAPPASKVRGGH